MSIDLHVHSDASDGTFTPEAITAAAAEKNLSTIALTDHDTIAGLDRAAVACSERGIRFVPGIELEIRFEPGEFHLLGLGLLRPTDEFREALVDLAKKREDRNREMIRLMGEAGIEASYDEVTAFASGKTVGRPHFASFLISRNIVKNREQAFSRFLAKGRPFWAPKAALELADAVRLVVESGGVPVLAHPLSLFVSWGRLGGLVEEFRDLGVAGLEAWHPAAKPRACERLERMAQELDMLVTGGSDFHGDNRPDRKLGLTAGGRTIDERYLKGIPIVEPACRSV